MTVKVDRIELNDTLTSILGLYGWSDDGSDETGDRLNDLTHEVADKLDDFLNENDPQTEPDPDRFEE